MISRVRGDQVLSKELMTPRCFMRTTLKPGTCLSRNSFSFPPIPSRIGRWQGDPFQAEGPDGFHDRRGRGETLNPCCPCDHVREFCMMVLVSQKTPDSTCEEDDVRMSHGNLPGSLNDIVSESKKKALFFLLVSCRIWNEASADMIQIPSGTMVRNSSSTVRLVDRTDHPYGPDISLSLRRFNMRDSICPVL